MSAVISETIVKTSTCLNQCIIQSLIQARHVGLMLAHRLRRWLNIKTTFLHQS